MTPELTQYLENIRRKAKLEQAAEPEVMSELEAHIEDTLSELADTGHSEEEAIRICVGQMGGTRLIARQIYEAHSQASWKHVLMATLPHLLFALIFTLNWWQHGIWMTVVLLLTLATAGYGWLHGKPNWLFSWLGFTLVPVLAVGILLPYLPGVWSLLALVIYFPLALWWLFRVVVETTKRDWIFGSLALVPLPIVSGWFLAISPQLQFTSETVQRVYAFAPWIGLSFLALALTIGTFIRVRQRWLRVALLITSGILTLTLVLHYTTGALTTGTFFGLMLVMWGIFLVPPLMDRFLRRDEISLRKDRDFIPSRQEESA
ncbi:MAG: permease prefix domain 1-containing protein [Dehalococcoidales bacterium]|nr:permease prefix domain 1-containing protein [Dehalococcoidales bacterium]